MTHTAAARPSRPLLGGSLGAAPEGPSGGSGSERLFPRFSRSRAAPWRPALRARPPSGNCGNCGNSETSFLKNLRNVALTLLYRPAKGLMRSPGGGSHKAAPRPYRSRKCLFPPRCPCRSPLRNVSMAAPSSFPVCPLCRPALPQRRVPRSIPLAAGSRQESRAVFPQFLDSFLLGLNKSPHSFPNEQLPEGLVINSAFCLLCIQMAINFFLLVF